MRLLTIDYETFSEADLPKVGATAYAQHPSTEIICLYWKLDDGPLNCWLPLEEDDYVPPTGNRHHDLSEIMHLFAADNVMVEAHNAGFEIAITKYVLSRHGVKLPPLARWRCSAAKAAVRALPRDLARACQVMGLDKQKDKGGHAIMMKVCKPRNRKTGTRWLPLPPPPEDAKAPVVKAYEKARSDFDRLYSYCGDDVLAEHELSGRLANLTPPERRVWELDQKANQRGVYIDVKSVVILNRLVEEEKERLFNEVCFLTSFELLDVGSWQQVVPYFERNGVFLPNYQAATIAELVKARLYADSHPDLHRLLEIRQATAKSSTAKLVAMLVRLCDDGTVKDNLKYHGANTGRWSGSGLQLQNLPRPTPGFDQDAAFALLATDPTLEEVRAAFGDILQFASNCIRGCLTAHPGHEFTSADFASIEARVLVWIAGDEEALDVFRQGGDIYIEMASAIYGFPINKKDHPDERQLGKMTILGCGYQMGAETFRAQADVQWGVRIDQETSERAVKGYREKYYKVKQLWADQEAAMLAAVRTGEPQTSGYLTYGVRGKFLHVRLPSGRLLSYFDPKVQSREVPWSTPEKPVFKDVVTYMTVDSMTNQWVRTNSYGGKIVENVVQAIARDLMAEAALRCEAAGFPLVCTIHDELLCITPEGEGRLKVFEAMMAELPAWAAGCPVEAEGWIGHRYRK
jgi:DNA polymerase